MANITNLQSFLRDVANAIKNKNGSTTNIRAENFDIEINNIQTGTITEDEYAELLTISQNILGVQDAPEDDTDTTHLQRPAEFLHSFYPMIYSQNYEGITLDGTIKINTDTTVVTDLLENFIPDLTDGEEFGLSFFHSEDDFSKNWNVRFFVSNTERYICISDPTSRDMMGEGFNSVWYYTRRRNLPEGMQLNTWTRIESDWEESKYIDVSDAVEALDYSAFNRNITSVTVNMKPSSLKTVDNIKSALSKIEKILNLTVNLDENITIPEESDGKVLVTIHPQNENYDTGEIEKGDELWWVSPVDDPETKYYIENFQVRLPDGDYYFYTDGSNNLVNLTSTRIYLGNGRTRDWYQRMIKIEDSVTVTFIFNNPNGVWMPDDISMTFLTEEPYWQYIYPILTPDNKCYVLKRVYTEISFDSFHSSVTNQSDFLNVDLTAVSEKTFTVNLN